MNMSYNGVRPTNRSEALIWNHYNDPDKWDWIKIRYWPRCLAVAVMTKSLNYTTRWQLLVYLIGNGKHPDIAGDEVLEMGFSYFDEDAKRHIRNLVKDIKRGKGRWEYFNEATRKREELTGFKAPEVKMTRPKGPGFGEDTSNWFWNGFRLIPKGNTPVAESEEEEDEEDEY